MRSPAKSLFLVVLTATGLIDVSPTIAGTDPNPPEPALRQERPAPPPLPESVRRPREVPGTKSERAIAERKRLESLARQQLAGNKGAEAIRSIEKIAALDREIGGDNSQQLSKTLIWLSSICLINGKPADAVRHANEAVQITKTLHGEKHGRTMAMSWIADRIRKYAKLTRKERIRLLTLDAEFEILKAKKKYAEALTRIDQLLPLLENTLGEEHPTLATALHDKADCLMKLGKAAEAEPFAKRAMGIRLKQLGKTNAQTAISATLLFQSLSDQKKYEECIEATRTCLECWKAQEQWKLAAVTSYGLGVFYRVLKRYDESRTALLDSIELYRMSGQSQPGMELFTELDNVAVRCGDYATAEMCRRAILKQCEKTHGPTHWRTISARVALSSAEKTTELAEAELKEICQSDQFRLTARALEQAGKYLDAAKLNDQVLSIRSRLTGEETDVYIATLNDLAALEEETGRYLNSQSRYRRALKIIRDVYGTAHPLYATTLSNVAILNGTLGNFELALRQHTESLTVRQEAYGKDNPDTAISLNNLGELFLKMERFERAYPLLRKAIQLTASADTKYRKVYVTALGNLAQLYDEIGDKANAVRLQTVSVKLKKQIFGDEHPGYALALTNLGSLQERKGDYGAAETHYRLALDIFSNSLGNNSREYALCYMKLARVLRRSGDATSLDLLRKGTELQKSILGADHPEYAIGLNLLAHAHLDFGNDEKAEALFTESNEILRRTSGEKSYDYANSLGTMSVMALRRGDHDQAASQIRRAIELLQEILERTAVVQSERQQLAMSQKYREGLDVLVSVSLVSGRFQDAAAQEIIRWKGSTLVRQRSLRTAATEPSLRKQLLELQAAARSLASVSRVAANRSTPELDQRIEELTDRKETLEADLLRASRELGLAATDATLKDIQQAIPGGCVLVDILKFSYAHADRKAGKWVVTPSFVATLIPHDGEPRLISLGSAASIESAVDTWRSSFGLSEESHLAGDLLRKRIWQPLQPFLDKDDTVLVSADGALGRFPLIALPGKAPHTWLLEEQRIAMVPVPQLLPAILKAKREPLSRELLMLGGIDYDAVPVESKVPVKRRRRGDAGNEASRLFGPLPGTLGEVATIEKVYRSTFEFDDDDILMLERSEATEHRFRTLAPHFYHLHLATHGFFAPAGIESALSIEAVHASAERGQLASQKPSIVGRNPGLLSGLALSGANLVPVPKQDDGILTAQEISFLPLSGVETVVLSACETGLGPVAGGEGLLGVQRAFQVAGARTTVASLWKVDDLVTRQLMERFYRNLWEKEMSRLDALREAQLWILNNPDSLRGATLNTDASNQPASKRRSPPKFWAAFTLSGDWR